MQSGVVVNSTTATEPSNADPEDSGKYEKVKVAVEGVLSKEYLKVVIIRWSKCVELMLRRATLPSPLV